jgi:PKD repeat protein
MQVVDEWSITLTGVGSEQLTRANFETLADSNRLTYTDASGTWSGVALWRILAQVDDADPATFSDTAADLGYNVTVKAGDGFSKLMTSSLLKRNDNFIVADRLNGTPLLKLDGSKQVWPLKIVGSTPTSGQKVGNISQIILSDFVAPPAAPIAGFIAVPLSGPAPLEVQFTDQSTGASPLNYAWDFNNDGTVDSTLQNPKVTLTNEGSYNVNLTVTNGAGSDQEVKTDFITVTATPIAPTAAFITDIQSGTTPLTVKFTDQSTGTGPLTYAWDFDNDGITDNTTQSPGYTYGTAGVYTVNLTVLNSAGSDSEVKIGHITVTSAPVVDTLFDGTVTLTPGETFIKQAYNNATGGLYTINRTTPLGALDKAATLQGFTYNVTDSRWSYDEVLLLDDLGQYIRKKPNYWYTYVNGVYKDGYQNHPNGLNVIELNNNDQVNFYYAPNKDPNPVVNATAVVKIKVNIRAQGPVVDTLFDGTVTLTPGETFIKQAYNNATGGLYTINRTTPLGALDKAATLQGFAYNVTDSRWSYDEVLLLDDLGQYIRKKPNYWYTYVNGVYKDGYQNHPNGLNVIELNNNDQVNFYYAPNKDPNPVVNATAVVKIKVNIGGSQPVNDWTLSLSGAKTATVSKTLFEQGLACPSSGHQVFWTDTDGNVWGGVPLWLLVGMVDDNPDVGSDHFNFNDSIAAQGYSVKVSSGDGWDTTLSSQNIARNNSILVVNTLNGQPLPLLTPAGKRSWPLHLKGDAVFGGQQVGNITKIELTGLPQPPTEWTLTLQGDVTDTITQSYFIDAIACHHNVTWTDSSNTVWEGVSLWDLAGAVDDIETSNHFTFNDTRATMGYTIRVSAADGYNATFASATAAHNDGYFVAYKKNGTALTGSDAPLKLVGSATTNGKQRVGGIVKISLEGLPDQYPAGNWQLKMVGKITDVIPQGEFEYSADCHNATYTDINGNVYTGIPLWRLMGWVDDRIPHGSDGFNDAAAIAGYKVIVKAGDGYAKEFTSQQIGKTNAFIIANTYNGGPIPNDGDHPPYPLRLVGSGATGGNSVGNVVEIQLTDFQTPVDVPKLHIIKYASDATTVINETYVDYNYMENNLPVIGDGITAYKFEGLTLDPSNLWDPAETYPGGFKISNVVKGSRVHDLAELVGGMGSGTTVTFVASDGFETTLPYSSIYTNPAVQARQGDAIIAWWGDGQYVPKYADGMRLFFMPSDHVYGQWDMHETLPSQYWRYNFQDGVQYPSSAGLSAKYITTIKVYSSPESDWTLELDGRDIGGLNYSVSKPFLEEALACQFGADHKASYSENGRVWEGMPLWFFAGFVDDADQHSPKAYNETMAIDGYNIVITGKDGNSTTIFSKDIIRSNKYIIANSLNGTHIPDTDESFPLRLTGENVTGIMTVKGVSSIHLVPALKAPLAAFSADPTSGTAPLTVKFTDQSTGTAPFTYAWDFNNDGITDNTTQNPAYTYGTAGVYAVNLTVTNSVGSNSIVKTGFITANPLPIDEWTISLKGTVNEPLTRVNFEALAAGNRLTYTDASGTWSGIALWRLLARVDDSDPSTFNDSLATLGYTVNVSAPDFSSTITSPILIRNDTWIVADTLNGAPLPKKDGTKNLWPLKIVGTGLTGKQKVGNISEISLSNFPVAPTAAFKSDIQTGTAALMVNFTDQSTGTVPFMYAWDFENDGVIDSALQNPLFTYAAPGTYTVNLTVTNGVGSDSELKTDYIKVNAPLVAPIAAFKSDIQTGTAPLIVNFTDQSTGTTPCTYAWDLNGDGKTESTEQSPMYTYTAPGTYMVNLTVTNGVGSDSELKTGYIKVNAPQNAPIAEFKSDIQTGTAPLIVKFIDQSTGTGQMTYAWDFNNDGEIDSTGANPSYTYKKPGSYSVKLSVRNAFGRDTELKTGYIIVTVKPPLSIKPIAAFSATPLSGSVPLTVKFTDQSTGTSPLTYAWDFDNDGKIDSSLKNPTYTYTKPGTYKANLTVTNSVGSASKQVTVTVQPLTVKKPVAKFTQTTYTGKVPLIVKFTDKSQNNPTSYLWRFGDGSSSTDMNPSHTYTSMGIYMVRFTATNSAGSDTVTSIVIALPQRWFR